MQNHIDEFLSMSEAVEISGYSRRQLTRLCTDGHLPNARKFENRWLVHKQELLDYTPGPKGPAPREKK